LIIETAIPVGIYTIVNVSELRCESSIIWYDADVLMPMEQRLFEPEWLYSEGHHRGVAIGRRNAHYCQFAGRDMVLRQFSRGGLIGKFNRNRYFFARTGNSRSMKEFTLLNWMKSKGLPVPRAFAARQSVSGFLYRADLITERIPNALPLIDVLQNDQLSDTIWLAIGQVIHHLHLLGVCHSDLNGRNILLDNEWRPWLIDFDKCRRRKKSQWTQRNLSRLRRSLEKSKRNNPDLNWTEQDWALLLSGYNSVG